jgi:hypothetical protein
MLGVDMSDAIANLRIRFSIVPDAVQRTYSKYCTLLGVLTTFPCSS